MALISHFEFILTWYREKHLFQLSIWRSKFYIVIYYFRLSRVFYSNYRTNLNRIIEIIWSSRVGCVSIAWLSAILNFPYSLLPTGTSSSAISSKPNCLSSLWPTETTSIYSNRFWSWTIYFIIVEWTIIYVLSSVKCNTFILKTVLFKCSCAQDDHAPWIVRVDRLWIRNWLASGN